MKYNGKELIEMTPEKWDGKTREMLVWDDNSPSPYKKTVVGYFPRDNYWMTDDGYSWHHCAEIPKEQKACSETEKLKEEIEELKAEIKSLRTDKVKMADSVSSAVWKELMNRAENIDGPVNTRMAGFGFNDISDIVLNKILEYKPEKNVRRMTYKELDDWLEQGKGVIRIADVVKNTISYDCEDRNNAVSDYYKICGYDEDTWHEPMIEE